MSEIDSRPEDNITLEPEEEDVLKALLKMCELEDEYVRHLQIRDAKKNDQFWHGFQYLFWDAITQDWRVPTHEVLQNIRTREEVQFVYDYVFNIFKAHGESIIAALAAELPYVQFSPDNADEPMDNRASRAATIRSKQIEDYNNAKEIFLHALFLMFTGHLLAFYTVHKKDESYGTEAIPTLKMEKQQTFPDSYQCQNCEFSTENEGDLVSSQPQPQNSFDNSDGEFNESANQNQEIQAPAQQCPQCQSPVDKVPGMSEMVGVPGIEIKNKGREIIDVFGILNIKVSSYAKDQEAIGYLIQYLDYHYAYARSIWPDKADEIGPSQVSDDFERIMRTPTTAFSSYAQERANMITVKRVWFRPWMLDALSGNNQTLNADDATIQSLKNKFPLGPHIDFVGDDIICAAYNDCLDKNWTLSKPGLSRTVHADPLGQPLIAVQEVKNTIANLKIQTIEYGIPEMFADPEVLDFDEYQQQESSPGLTFPAKPKPGTALSDSFYTRNAAILSKEVEPLEETLTSDAQFLVGSFPSVFGGEAQGGSKTFGEYQASRNYALQRLSIPWQLLSAAWSDVMFKSVKSSFEHQVNDDNYTTRGKAPGQFASQWIKTADTQGNFKYLQPEVGTDFPTSFAQKRSVMMSLVQLNNPDINALIESTDNVGTTARLIGLTDFRIVGELQNAKQLREIAMLVNGEPSENAMDGSVTPSVPIEPEIDDDEAHIKICVDFLISDTGQDLKEDNPNGYKNVIAHKLAHDKNIQMKAMAAQQQAQLQQMQTQGAQQ